MLKEHLLDVTRADIAQEDSDISQISTRVQELNRTREWSQADVRPNPVVVAARAKALSHASEARDSQIERHGDGRVVFASQTSFHGAGCRYSVHDVDQSAGRIRKVAHESAEATHRVFVMADGSRWVYPFKRCEARTMRAQLLELQIDGAQYFNSDPTRTDGR